MATTFIAKIKDKQFRVIIPVDIRDYEKLEVGDFVKVTVEKVEK